MMSNRLAATKATGELQQHETLGFQRKVEQVIHFKGRKGTLRFND